MPGMESSKLLEERVPTPDEKESKAPEAEFDLESFLAEQGASLVEEETKLDKYTAVISSGHQVESVDEKSNKIEEGELLDDDDDELAIVESEAEPEPIANVLVLVETNKAEQKKTVGKKDPTTVVDPIVKMLVELEENDGDIQKEQTSDAIVD